MKSFFEAIEVFDKSKSELEEQRLPALSYIFSLAGFLLILGQFFSILRPQLVRDLDLQTTSLEDQELVNVSINILVNMPCYFLHLDVVDSLGIEQLDINTTAKFYRMKRNGKIIGLSNDSISDVCHPCFGLQPKGICCNSCEQIMWMLMQNNISKKAEDLPQCKGMAKTKVYLDERCKIKGKVSLNKAQGNFHIAPGSNIRQLSGHMHNLWIDTKDWDLSHYIASMRVGPKIPLTYNPLNKYQEKQPPDLQIVYKYSMIVTPAIYKIKGKVIGKGYDYTAMINKWLARVGGSAPGLYFHYSFTPYGVTVTANYISPGQMITSTFGFLAGIYAIFSLIDNSNLFQKAEGPKGKSEIQS